MQSEMGTTFLIQGAPGAGKTALFAECEKQAKGEGWRVARLGPLESRSFACLTWLEENETRGHYIHRELPRPN